jgi:RNA-directed DNA polymerase
MIAWPPPMRRGQLSNHRAANKAIEAFKDRIRGLTPRLTGRGLRTVTERLRIFILGWKAYFGLARTPRVWRTLDEWIHHRLRAIQLRQWRRGKTIFRELTALGAKPDFAAQVAGNARRWWRDSSTPSSRSDGQTKWGCPDLRNLNLSNRPVRIRMPGGVAGERPLRPPPMPIVSSLLLDTIRAGDRQNDIPSPDPRSRRH